MNFARIILAPLLLPALFASSSPQAPIDGELNCPAVCLRSPFAVENGDSNWYAAILNVRSGKGTDPYCNTCDPCSGTFIAIHVGNDAWSWANQSGGSGTGTGSTTVTWPTTTDCNGAPEHLILTGANGNMTAALYCPCQA